MKDNTTLQMPNNMYMDIMIFKNNRLFKDGTRAYYTVEMFKHHATRVREYISDPGIGYKKVEKILNAAHALKLQVSRMANERVISDDEKRRRIYEKNQPKRSDFPLLEPIGKNYDESRLIANLNKVPLEPEDDILAFMLKYGKHEDWQKDLISIAREEALYFIPQIETKVMNEGWASYWHYKILNKLELPQGLHVEFLKRHNQVIKPHLGYKSLLYRI